MIVAVFLISLSRDLAAIIDRVRDLDRPSERGVDKIIQVLNRAAAVIDEAVSNQIPRQVRTADHDSKIIYALGETRLSAERAEVGHLAPAIEESLRQLGARTCGGQADNVPPIVHPKG